MLIFIENTPRSYAWGSRDALPQMLGTAPTGEPQAELWLGDHPGHPATVAKATPGQRTLIDLIESDPERYGVDGGHLPFLLKVLAIGAPLSLQVHPDAEQAAAGFAAEEAAGVPRDARERNYGDPRHKPELLVALGEVTALCGFRDLVEVRRDLSRIAAHAPEGAARDALYDAADRLSGGDPEALRSAFLAWVFSGEPGPSAALRAISAAVRAPVSGEDEAHSARLTALRNLTAAHPGDPGILVSLLLHLVHLAPGEAVYLGARQLHAYLSGIGVEVMASSDNVLRAGLTSKHVDIEELCRIVDLSELADPRFHVELRGPGLVAWQPDVPDFRLMRARLREPDDLAFAPSDSAEQVVLDAPFPLVLIVTEGRVRVERPAAELAEVASVRRGQSLYVSAGEAIQLSGRGEVFLATVGESFACE
ncbi:mannose-6-phosphate isomerase, class I [Leucobacter sp. CSA1]|uniref:mannose-6-phosphate isomerase n=1 Tax=Leucobacter chromiisoli TaxID=2796471 RepID=A0A934USV2_9MICO|nr:mannose-6-phosphate isomerase, class I [Leucobacter chromiisoli]MBK0417694.1 mannose-6-phosphate isomerase, class I [Leucobacter chromiisoli]